MQTDAERIRLNSRKRHSLVGNADGVIFFLALALSLAEETVDFAHAARSDHYD